MKKLKVLFLIDSLKMGGAERITVSLLPHFQQIEPVVATLHDDDSPLLSMLGAVPFWPLHATRLLDPQAFKRFLRLLDEQQFDVIHAQLQHATVFAALANRLRGIPVVTTRHVISDNTSTWKSKLRVRMEQLATRFGVERVIYVSKAALDAHQRSFSYPDSRRLVIHNGIEIERFLSTASPQATRLALGLKPNARTVTLIGVMRPGKGHSVAIALARELPDTEVLLVGDGELSEELRLEASTIPNVHFGGARKDIADILAATSVLILPSESEALPTVLIEAGAASVPVVATRVGGVSEAVVDGETGFLISPGDWDALAKKVRFLLDNPSIAESMGQKASRFVAEHFSIERQVLQLSTLYRDLAQS